eukprot:PRCOL_00006294-RA
MVFVYQRSNKPPKDGADVCERRCKRLACAIQTCIATRARGSAAGRYDFQRDCAAEIARFDACCANAKAEEARGLSGGKE